MNTEQRRTLTDNLLTFCDDLDVPELLIYLQSKHVLNDRHVGEIQSMKTDYERRHRLVRMVQQRGPSGYTAFYDGLAYSGQEHLAALLKPALPADHVQNGAGPRAIRHPRSRSVSPMSADDFLPATPPRLADALSGELASMPLEAPSAAAIDGNQCFYRKLLNGLNIDGLGAETSGVLNLNVECVDSLPPYYHSEDVYPNFSKPKGLALLINNRKFSSSDLPERHGSDIDAANLTHLFQQLGYRVKVKKNLGAQDMMGAMGRFALKAEHSLLDSAVVVVLTHGLHGQFYGADGALLDIGRFVSALDGRRCPRLVRKPKLFFFQACRGDTYDPGLARDQTDAPGGGDAPVEMVQALVNADVVDANAVAKQLTPTDADMMVAYATTPGYVSWRNSMRGSWFVQAICKTFAQYASQEDLLSMMTRVNRMVADQFTSSTGHKQVPEPTFRLTKKFYYFPGYYRPA